MFHRMVARFVRETGGVAEGLGIGLTLVGNLVTQHGGRITATSDGPGRGSTFTIELPLAAAPRAAENGADEPAGRTLDDGLNA